MAEALTFVLLGLGAGAAYAISGIGLVQVYRGSGVINFAHGAMALLSAALYAQFSTVWDWPWPVALGLAVGASVCAGLLTQLLVMHPLRAAAPLVRMIATVGVLAIIEQGVPLVLGNIYQESPTTTNFYPKGGIDLIEGARLTYDRIIMVAIVVVVGAGLTLLMQRTRFGLATSAVAEDTLVAQAMRVNPERVAMVNWALGGGLAGLAGALMVPWAGLSPGPFTLLVVPALAAAIVARFRSFPVTVVAGLALGAAQSLIQRYQIDFMPEGFRTGWNEALPFVVILVVLAVRGSVFPRRDESSSALPRVGRRRLLPLHAVGWAVVLGSLTLLAGGELSQSIASTASIAMIGLSLVVVTGLAGQISLAQVVMAGIGTLVAARLSGEVGLPFPVLLLVAMGAGAAAGFLFALPALRTRGPTLAVATIAVGLAVEKVVFATPRISGSTFSGTPVERPSLFGVDINAVAHPERFAATAVVVMVVLMFVVSNLRAGPVGRRFLAVRSNERAAAALGISVQRAKLAAFVISAALASVGGVFVGFKFDNVLFTTFTLVQSLLIVVFTLIGGVGFILGPLIGAAVSPSGVVSFLFNDLDTIERWLIILSGVILIVQLIVAPDGLVVHVLQRLGRGRAEGSPYELAPPGLVTTRSSALEVRGLEVRYGEVIAVSSLDLTVRPGEIVGLIGPNGAGKTSAIDALTGFIPMSAGSVRLGGDDLTSLPAHERARRGLARTFQTVEPFDDLTVAENLAAATDAISPRGWLSALVRVPPMRLPAGTAAVVESFDLHDELGSFPHELPQGRRRLLGVARAMATAPSVLLLDEPAAGLDATETRQLGDLLRRVARESGVGMLLVEHDMSIVNAVCDHVVALDFGETIYDGEPEAVMAHAAVRAAYLGEDLDADPEGVRL